MSRRLLAEDKFTTLYKRVEVRIFYPGNKKSKLQRHVAAAGKGYSPEDVTRVLDTVADRIEKQWFPGHEYRLVELGPDRYNFVWECAKQVVPELKRMEAASGE